MSLEPYRNSTAYLYMCIIYMYSLYELFPHQWWMEGITDVLWRVIAEAAPNSVTESLVR